MLTTTDLLRFASAMSDAGFVDWLKFIALSGLYGSVIRYVAKTVADYGHVAVTS